MTETLIILLRIAASVQLAIAALNLFLPRILGWRENLQRMPLLMREVFHVHAWFVSITLIIFALISWRFAPDLADPDTNPLARWLAASIGGFWAIRTAIQVFYYSSSHWRGLRGPTIVHITLLVIYGAMSAVYLWCSFRP